MNNIRIYLFKLKYFSGMVNLNVINQKKNGKKDNKKNSVNDSKLNSTSLNLYCLIYKLFI